MTPATAAGAPSAAPPRSPTRSLCGAPSRPGSGAPDRGRVRAAHGHAAGRIRRKPIGRHDEEEGATRIAACDNRLPWEKAWKSDAGQNRRDEPEGGRDCSCGSGTISCRAPQARPPPAGRNQGRQGRRAGFCAASAIPGSRRRNSSITAARLRATAEMAVDRLCHGCAEPLGCSLYVLGSDYRTKQEHCKWLAWYASNLLARPGEEPSVQPARDRKDPSPCFSFQALTRDGVNFRWLLQRRVGCAVFTASQQRSAGRTGGQPWCAVIEYDGDVTWECVTHVEECQPDMLPAIAAIAACPNRRGPNRRQAGRH